MGRASQSQIKAAQTIYAKSMGQHYLILSDIIIKLLQYSHTSQVAP